MILSQGLCDSTKGHFALLLLTSRDNLSAILKLDCLFSVVEVNSGQSANPPILASV